MHHNVNFLFDGFYQSAVLVAFLPTILLWTFSALLPNAVYYSDQFVGHWTK